jgi:3-dehydroquinate dehydratase
MNYAALPLFTGSLGSPINLNSGFVRIDTQREQEITEVLANCLAFTQRSVMTVDFLAIQKIDALSIIGSGLPKRNSSRRSRRVDVQAGRTIIGYTAYRNSRSEITSSLNGSKAVCPLDELRQH